jgi:hypothetical protein
MNDASKIEETAADCPNCGARIETPATDAKYCASCGQKRIEPHELTVTHFFGNLVHEITHLDSNKILKTFAALLTRPGHLTREYLAGRKGQYIKPVRIYLTVSALYFLFAWGALSAAGGGDAQSNQTRPFIVNLARERGVEPSVLAIKVQEKAGKISAVLRFASVLLSGLFLMLLYRGTKRYYVEHLIFSIHFYSFDFLAKCVVALFYLTSDYTGQITFAVSRTAYYFAAFVYIFFAQLRVYGQPWPKTLFKAAAQFLLEILLFIGINVAGFILAVAFA